MIIFMKTIISRKMMMITTITLYLTRNQQLGCGLVHPSPPSSPAAAAVLLLLISFAMTRLPADAASPHPTAAAAYIICHDTPSRCCCRCCLYHQYCDDTSDDTAADATCIFTLSNPTTPNHTKPNQTT